MNWERNQGSSPEVDKSVMVQILDFASVRIQPQKSKTTMLVSRTGRWEPLSSCGTVRRAAESENPRSPPSTTSRTKRDSTGPRPSGDHRLENMLTFMCAYNQCLGSGSWSGFGLDSDWIRILDPDSIRSVHSESGRGQIWPTKIEKRKFYVWSAGCSLLRAEGFSCNLDVLHGGLDFWSKNIKLFSAVFYQFLGSRSRSVFSQKWWTQLIRIRNTAYIACNARLEATESWRGGREAISTLTPRQTLPLPR